LPLDRGGLRSLSDPLLLRNEADMSANVGEGRADMGDGNVKAAGLWLLLLLRWMRPLLLLPLPLTAEPPLLATPPLLEPSTPSLLLLLLLLLRLLPLMPDADGGRGGWFGSIMPPPPGSCRCCCCCCPVAQLWRCCRGK
jgi:hypothetical protein